MGVFDGAGCVRQVLSPSIRMLAARGAGSCLAPAPDLGGICREPCAVHAARMCIRQICKRGRLYLSGAGCVNADGIELGKRRMSPPFMVRQADGTTSHSTKPQAGKSLVITTNGDSFGVKAHACNTAAAADAQSSLHAIAAAASLCPWAGCPRAPAHWRRGCCGR